MTEFEDDIVLAQVSDCPPGSALERVAAGRMIAIFNVDGTFYGLDGVCPHQGGPLGKGCLQGATVTCPWHGWQFDVRTGQNSITRSICQPTIPLRVEGEAIVARRADLIESS